MNFDNALDECGPITGISVDALAQEKTCSKCRRKKPISEFGIRLRSTGLRQALCKECSSALSAKRYRGKSSKEKQKLKAEGYAARQRNRELVWDYLSNHPCVDCGEDDPVVLQFHHKDGSEKRITVSNAITRMYSVKSLMEEIRKCEVRCANCHIRRTAEELGWWIATK